jgi:hypothetical protein
LLCLTGPIEKVHAVGAHAGSIAKLEVAVAARVHGRMGIHEKLHATPGAILVRSPGFAWVLLEEVGVAREVVMDPPAK